MDVLKVQGSWYQDYWFTNEGVARVTIYTQTYAGLLSLWIIPEFILAETYLGVLAGIIIWIPSYIIVVYYLRFLAIRRRRQISILPPDQVMNNPRMTVKVPWETIRGVRLKNRDLAITAGKKTFGAKVREADVEALRNLLLAKIGDRFEEA